MSDPNWNNGFYYDGLPPHTGMKLARRTHVLHIASENISFLMYLEIATITYRSGPEWDLRFGRKLRPLPESDSSSHIDATGRQLPRKPALCPDFQIETYLDYQVRQLKSTL